MELFFNWMAVVSAAVIGLFVGMLWHSVIFKRWYLEGEGLTLETLPKKTTSYKWRVLTYSLLLHGVLAVTLAIILDIVEPDSLRMALYTSLLLSVGIVSATRFIDLLNSPVGTYNSGRNQKKFLVSATYYIVLFAVMTIVMYHVR
jgi:hypothetical protein